MNWLIGAVVYLIVALIIAMAAGRRLRRLREAEELVKELQDLTIDQQVEIGRLRHERCS